ncbi:MAG: DEAD/DEAH box helicase, partial [Clostridiaceae bacterium]|nr:DEAD/DEAH box helicase [Clostridiaceae bacterium]
KKGICAKVNFCYGDKVISQLKGGMENHDCFYMRNYEQEEKVTDFLVEAGMRIKSDMLILEDDGRIAEFLSEKLGNLGKLAEIYYSQEFKKIQIKTVRSVKMGVSVNSNSNLLEFNFELDDFDDSEINSFFNSIKQKKRYFRLKNGAILKLDNRGLISVSELLESLNLDNYAFKNGTLNLPLNRALFIDSFLSEKKPEGFKTDHRFRTLVENIAEPVSIEYSLEEKLDKVLREYQKFGLRWLKVLSIYGFGGILADDMGLGKTLQVLAFINMEKNNCKRPCLVVAPTSLIYNWKSEALKFVPDLKVEVIYGIKADRKKALCMAAEADIIVTSYGSLKSDLEQYSRMEFSYVFIDEAQHIKNPNTLNANSVKSLKAKGCFALTGTPIENSLTELWSIFDFIMPGYLMNYSGFVSKFERPIVLNNDKERLNTLSKFIRPFILRRLKSEVLKELPEKIESLVVSDMTREQKKLYYAYVKKAREEIDVEIKEKGIERSKIKILALLTRLRQLCCHPSMFVEDYKGGSGKLETLLEIVGDSIDSGHRMLLFSQFTSMHRIIGKELTGLGIEYFYLDGATKATERINMADRFNNGEKKLFLISLKAGGTGLNLVGADMVIHFDPWWNPAVEDQATDRAYRIGQKKVVQVFKIITKGTIEERIYELQQRKKGLIENVIKSGENLLTKLSEEEIRELFYHEI